MPLPRWMARSVSRYVNPGALKRDSWPVLVHVGRKSGEVHRTPVGAESIEGGYLFFINYGKQTDWVRNIVAAGSAVLLIDGEEIALTNPRVVAVDDAYRLLSKETKRPPGWVGLEECLVTDIAGATAPTED